MTESVEFQLTFLGKYPFTTKIDNDSLRNNQLSMIISQTKPMRRRLVPNESAVYNMESYICKKGRINSISQRRNGIPERSPGDKCYKEVDREPEFYKAGGIITGSTIRERVSARPKLRKNDMFTSKGSNILLRSTYTERKVEKESNQDKLEVSFLNNSTHVAGAVIPSWEDRSGMRILNPDEVDDDNDEDY